MNMKYAIIGMVTLLGAMLGCQSPQKQDNGTADSNNDQQILESRPFVNDEKAAKYKFFLNIVGEEKTDSTIIYTAKSLFKEDTVGLKIEVLKEIAAGVTATGEPDQENGFVPGAIRFSSLGADSDHFVQALQELFDLKDTGKMTMNTVAPLVFSSNNEAIDLNKNKQATYSFKLFLENDLGAEAEVFAVLDTYRKSFEISEKDNSFRAQIIAAFAAN
ncbi:hypothetical protein [Sphingobacterium corticibacter]|uniref:Lipoprotein n=1 Tax=Sphingobacterium corticibacter TaxID=2171749 RepID=A0A2T8HMK8_9SPHI|nr:hypothetical protein [Sphingobacterium corticibacter]PVH26674.1 hypothetical protein DC487_03420 [Sphingobacterium corticibacter]